MGHYLSEMDPDWQKPGPHTCRFHVVSEEGTRWGWHYGYAGWEFARCDRT